MPQNIDKAIKPRFIRFRFSIGGINQRVLDKKTALKDTTS